MLILTVFFALITSCSRFANSNLFIFADKFQTGGCVLGFNIIKHARLYLLTRAQKRTMWKKCKKKNETYWKFLTRILNIIPIPPKTDAKPAAQNPANSPQQNPAVAKSADSADSANAKSADSANAKSADSAETKSADADSAVAKSADSAETKSAETNSAEKPADSKSDETNPADANPADQNTANPPQQNPADAKSAEEKTHDAKTVTPAPASCYKQLTKAEKEAHTITETLKAFINAIRLILTKEGFDAKKYYDVFTSNATQIDFEEKIVRHMIELINSLNTGKKIKKLENNKDLRFANIRNKFFDSLPKPDEVYSPEAINAIIKFYTVFNNEIAPLVRNISTRKIVKQLINFINQQRETQKKITAAAASAKSVSTYCGAFIPPTHCRGNGSGHCTVAFGDNIKKWMCKLATIVRVKISKNTVNWKHTDEKQYAYQIVQIMFDDNTKDFTGHMSIHIPNGGTNFALNHKHQKNTNVPDNIEWGEEFQTIFCNYSVSRDKLKDVILLQLDLDGTLFYVNYNADGTKQDFNDSMLSDASLLNINTLTGFGKFIRTLEIPFRIVTSRRQDENPVIVTQILTNICAIFPNCTNISYGTKLSTTNVKETRDVEKAKCKTRRQNEDGFQDVCGIDDEAIVITTRGYGSVVVNHDNGIDFTLTNHYNEFVKNTNTRNKIIQIAITGTVGIGKTHFVEALAKKLNAIPGSEFKTTTDIQINGKYRPILFVYSPDGNCPHFDNIPNSFPHIPCDREIIIIFDSTGVNHNIKCESFNLGNSALTAMTFVGCLKQILNRKGHSTLNGTGKFNLHDTAKVQQPSLFYPNDYNITQFINHMWFNFGTSENLFNKAMNALKQNAKFKRTGDVIYLITSYLEGHQCWTTRWGVENRNCVHYWSEDEGRWKLSLTGLPAGPEVKQDKDEKHGDQYEHCFSGPINAIRDAFRFCKSLPSDTIFTSKKDGCLARVVLIIEDVDILYKSIMASGNEFAIMMAKESYLYSSGKSFILIATNGTYIAPKEMWDYILTSFSTIAGIDVVQLQNLLNAEPVELNTDGSIDTQKQVLKAWSQVVGPVNIKLQELFANIITNFNIRNNLCLQFEMICANRTTCCGTKHPELASGYPFSSCDVLAFTSDLKMYPHHMFEEIINTSGFTQPGFWKINKTTILHNMLYYRQQISLGTLTSAEFIAKFPPSNRNMTNFVFDPEGFIGNVPLYFSLNGIIMYTFMYIKLKTFLFYMLHTLKEANVNDIIDLVDNHELKDFPLAKIVRDTNSDIKKKIGTRTTLPSTIVSKFIVSKFKEYGNKVLTQQNITGKHKTYYSETLDAMCRYPSETNIINWIKPLVSKLRTMPALHKSLELDLYKIVMVTYGAKHIYDKYCYISTLATIKPNSADAKLKAQMNNSINTVAEALCNYEFSTGVQKLNTHMLFMLITFPAPTERE